MLEFGKEHSKYFEFSVVNFATNNAINLCIRRPSKVIYIYVISYLRFASTSQENYGSILQFMGVEDGLERNPGRTQVLLDKHL